MKLENIEVGQVWKNGSGVVRVVHEVNAHRDEVWFTSDTWISSRDLKEDYEFIGSIGRDDRAFKPYHAPTTMIPGQVWRHNSDSTIVVITELRGDYGIVAPDHEMSLDFLNRKYTCIGHLADNYLLRTRPAADFTVMKHSIRMQADKLHAQGQKMIDDAKKLREAADLLGA